MLCSGLIFGSHLFLLYALNRLTEFNRNYQTGKKASVFVFWCRLKICFSCVSISLMFLHKCIWCFCVVGKCDCHDSVLSPGHCQTQASRQEAVVSVLLLLPQQYIWLMETKIGFPYVCSGWKQEGKINSVHSGRNYQRGRTVSKNK